MTKCLNMLALILMIIGALNWGLWGFFQFDIVAWLFHGNTAGPSRLIYSIIGLAGVWSLGFLGRCRTVCGSGYVCEKCNKEEKNGKGSGCCRM